MQSIVDFEVNEELLNKVSGGCESSVSDEGLRALIIENCTTVIIAKKKQNDKVTKSFLKEYFTGYCDVCDNFDLIFDSAIEYLKDNYPNVIIEDY